MARRRDDGRRALNAIESELWTSDPEFYRQFDRAWCSLRNEELRAAAPQRQGALWLLPLGLIVGGFALSVIVISSR